MWSDYDCEGEGWPAVIVSAVGTNKKGACPVVALKVGEDAPVYIAAHEVLTWRALK